VPARQRSVRAAAKKLLVKGLYRSGVLRLSEKIAGNHEVRRTDDSRFPRLRRARMPRFAILCYHRIGIGGIPFYSELPPKTFENQMRYIRSRYRVISLEQMVTEIAHPQGVLPTVAITFDDGYRDLFTNAFPILQAYHIPATIFLTAGCIETGEVAWYDRVFLALRVARGRTLELTLDDPRSFLLSSEASRLSAAVDIIRYLRTVSSSQRREICAVLESLVPLPTDQLRDRMLTWEQVGTMDRAGISFGSHTMSHPVVSRLTQLELETELLESAQIIEKRLGRPVQSFAFPFGKREDCGGLPRELLLRAGYRCAVTTELGLNTPLSDPLELNRISVDEDWPLAMFGFQLNRFFLQGSSEQIKAQAVVSSEVGRTSEQARFAAR
jgi:peptidoglycan/xylan/chitin deacetylase (PgdA/CDA1 family)